MALRLGCGKIVFALLYEVIEIYVRFTLIDIWYSWFENLLWEVFEGSLILFMDCKESCFPNRFENLLKIILHILKNLGNSQTRSRVQRIYWFIRGFWRSRKFLYLFVSTLETWSRRVRCGFKGLVLTEMSMFSYYKYSDRYIKTLKWLSNWASWLIGFRVFKIVNRGNTSNTIPKGCIV